MNVAAHERGGWAPDWATHPGEHLADHLDARGWSQADFARLADLSPKLVSTIISGKNPVTPETAIRFERVLGMKAYIWTGLQAAWDLQQARRHENDRVDAASWLKEFPVPELKQRGIVPNTRDDGHTMDALLSAFGVATPHALDMKVSAMAVHHRQAKRH